MAAQIGLSVQQLDRMTPHELSLYAKAYSERQEREQEQRVHEVYLTALLIARFVWAKKIPRYDELFGDGHETGGSMTAEEMLRMARSLNMSFGGETRLDGDG